MRGIRDITDEPIGASSDSPEDPSHYELFGGEKETLDLIRDRLGPDRYRGYLEGNTIKYLMRWDRKHDDSESQVADLKKARTYIELLISEAEDE